MNHKENLYKVLTKRFNNLGSFEEFSSKLDNYDHRRNLHNILSKRFNNLGSFEEFNSKLGYGTDMTDGSNEAASGDSVAAAEPQPTDNTFTARELGIEPAGTQRTAPAGTQAQKATPAGTQAAAAPKQWKAGGRYKWEDGYRVPNYWDARDTGWSFTDPETGKPRTFAEQMDATKSEQQKAAEEYGQSKMISDILAINSKREAVPAERVVVDEEGNEIDRYWVSPELSEEEMEYQQYKDYINKVKLDGERWAELVAARDAVKKDYEEELGKAYDELKDVLVYQDALNPFGPEQFASNRKEISDLKAAKKYYDDALKMVDEARDAQDSADGFLGELEGLWRGAWDAASDMATWDMGMSDMQQGAAVLTAIMKLEDGKPLTKNEERLLNAAAAHTYANSQLGEQIGLGYKAGQTTMMSVPFMIEMAVNPASGLGTAGSKALTKHLMKKYGKEMIEKQLKKRLKRQLVASKLGSQVAGDAGAAVAMTATTGQGMVIADAEQRMIGTVKPTEDEEGNIVYGGRSEDHEKNAAIAYAKAFGAGSIERHTEMVGGYLPAVKTGAAKFVTAAAKKTKSPRLKKIYAEASDILDGKALGKWGETMGKLADKTKLNDLAGEFFEEKVGEVENALLVGDMTFDANSQTGIFNLDRNIETLVGLLPMQAAFGAMTYAGYRTQRVRQKKAMRAAEQMNQETFGDRWGAIKSELDGCETNEQLSKTLLDKMRQSNSRERAALLSYVKAVQQQRGLDEVKREVEETTGVQIAEEADEATAEPTLAENGGGNLTPALSEGEGAQASEDLSPALSEGEGAPVEQGSGVVSRAQQAYQRGAAAVESNDNAELEKIGYEYDLAEARVGRLFDEQQRAEIDEASGVDGGLETWLESNRENLSAEQADAIERMSDAQEAYTGVVDSNKQQMADEQEKLRRQMQPFAMQNGALVELQLVNGTRVWLKSGDPTDKRKTVMASFYDADHGIVKTTQISGLEIERVGTPMSVDEYVASKLHDSQDALATQREQLMNGKSVAAGQTVKLYAGDELQEYEVTAMNDGIASLQAEDGSQMMLSQEELQEEMAATRQRLIEEELNVEAEEDLTPESLTPALSEGEGAAEGGVQEEARGSKRTGEESLATLAENGAAEVSLTEEEAQRADEVIEQMESVEAITQSLAALGDSPLAKTLQGELYKAERRLEALTESMNEADKAKVGQRMKQREDKRREPLRQRAREWEAKTGTKVELIEDAKDVKTGRALRAIIDAEGRGAQVKGWYDKDTGKVYLYMPHIDSEKEIDETYIHEVVAHKGMRELLGEKQFNALCDMVWNSMSSAAKKRFEAYEGVADIENQTARQRAAADEYMAHLAEKMNLAEQSAGDAASVTERIEAVAAALTAEEKTIWDKIVGYIKNALESMGVGVSDNEIETLIRASYSRMTSEGLTPALSEGEGAAEGAVQEEARGLERTEEGIGKSLNKEEAEILMNEMEAAAETAPDIELTIENWDALFGQEGKVSTPIGNVKMGENQFAKMMRQGRDTKLGMVKPTLENPYVIIEVETEAKKGTITERPSSYIFVRSFVKKDGTRYYYFTSITVSKDNKEVVISNQEKSRNRIMRLLQEGSVIWRTPKDATTSSAEKQGLDYALSNKAETVTKGSEITPQTTSSGSKDTDNTSEMQERSVKSAEKVSKAKRKRAQKIVKTAGQKRLEEAKKEYAGSEAASQFFEDMDVAHDANELVAMTLGKGSINWEGIDRGEHHVRGLQEELGRDKKRGLRKESDTYGYNQYLARKGEGKGIDEIVHDIWENEANSVNGEKRFSTEEIRDALLDVLTSAQKPSDISDYVLMNRIAQAEAALEYENEAAAYEQELYEQEQREMAEQEGILQLTDEVIAQMNADWADKIAEIEEKLRTEREIFRHLLEQDTNTEEYYGREEYYAGEESADKRGIRMAEESATGRDSSSIEGSQAVHRGTQHSVEGNRPMGNEQVPETALGRETGRNDDSKNVRSQEAERSDLGETEAEPQFAEKLEAEKAATNTNPTDAQKEAGNYKKGHLTFGGYKFTIENPKGSVRSGKNKKGKAWKVTMPVTYGYILGKKGKDGDHLDMFINDNADLSTWNGEVFVIDQVNPETGKFDEHKVMYGFNNITDAMRAYLMSYTRPWKGLGNITGVSKEKFDEWVASSERKLKRFAETRFGDKADVGTKVIRAAEARAGKWKKENPEKQGVRFRVSQTPEEFDATFKKAVEERGIVAPMLSEANINVVEVPKHDFTGNLKEARKQAGDWAVENYVGKEFDLPDNSGKYIISKNAINKYLDKSAFDKSETAAIHLSALKALPNIISNSIETEIHADYVKKGNEGRSTENGINRTDLLVHRMYGAINIDGNIYRVKTTIYEFRDAKTANVPHSYEVTKIELMEDSSVTPNDGIDRHLNRSTNSISVAKLLKDVEKSYDKGKKVLDESKDLTSDSENATDMRFRVKDIQEEYDIPSELFDYYKKSIELGNLTAATQALNGIKDVVRQNIGKKLSEFVSVYKGIRDVIFDELGNIEKLREERERAALEQYDLMEAARKRAEEEAAIEAEKSRQLEMIVDLDSEYDKALQENDMERAQDLVSEAARRKGYIVTDYKDAHSAPVAQIERKEFTNLDALRDLSDNGFDLNVFALANGISNQPLEIFDRGMERAYMNDNASGRESLAAIRSAIRAIKYQLSEHGEVKDMPKIKVYRAVPKSIKGGLESGGQWVSPSLTYTQAHGEHRHGEGKYRIIEEEVPADELWWDGNDVREWGFDDGRNYVYKNTKNNKKLFDTITYDDAGKIIPLSKRFNSKKTDVRFRVKKSFEAGSEYDVEKRADKYFEARGLVTGAYQTPHQLLEAVRNKHEEYAWKINDDATKIECLGRWDEMLPKTKKNGRNDKNHNKRIAKKTERAKAMIGDVAKMLGLDVEVLEDTDNLTGKKKTAKGWYDVTTGKITVVLPNHTSNADVMATLLHEGVAHHGLRKMFGKDFDAMLDNVYEAAWAQDEIDALAGENASKERIREATEEYLARLAEDINFEKATEQKWWSYIKEAFVSMLRKAGVTIDVWLTDNELRYLLWRSYQNLKETSEQRTALETMEDYKKQKKLGVYDGTGRIEPAAGVAEDIRFSYTEEEQTIVDEAKKNGTWMKAPNGKATNLTEKQWAQVRTKAFKKWFGDWEKVLRIAKLRKSKPVDIVFNGEYELNRDSAKQWMKDNLRGEYVNEDTGEKITITKIGANKVTSHGERNEAHLKSIVAIPSLIEKSVFIEELPNEKENDKYDSYRYYVCGAQIDGIDYTIKVVVGVKGDVKYYDHRLTQIEKGTLIDNLNGMANSVVENQNADISVGKDTKLLSILQTNASKIVDENGEPMVVYHDTNSTIFINRETGENWDDLDWRARAEWEERDDWDEYWEEQDFYTFDNKNHGRRSVEMPAFFFTPNYDEYHEYGDRTIAAFLNIRNPKIDPRIKDAGVTNTAGEDAMNALIEEGYDGFIRTEDGVWYETNAFYPNQIKSATDNVGTFDEGNDDIRFRFVGEQGAANMDKAEEATVRLDNLSVAREMEEAGKDAKSIKMATGWERGADGKWRYEVDDKMEGLPSPMDKLEDLHKEYKAAEKSFDRLMETSNRLSRLPRTATEEQKAKRKEFDKRLKEARETWLAKREAFMEADNRRSYTLEEILGTEHELFAAYPQLKTRNVSYMDKSDYADYYGAYMPESGDFWISPTADNPMSVLTHEIQHAIQHIEGFARGGNTRSVQTKAETLKKDVQPLYEMIHDTPEWAEYKMLVNDYFDEYGKDQLDNDKIAEIESRLNEIEDSGVLKEIESKRKELKRKYGADATVTKILNGPYSSFDEIWEQLPSDFYDKFDAYYRLGGEVEARNAAERMGMSSEERRASLAEETEDVAREDQVFIFDGLESAAMPQSTKLSASNKAVAMYDKANGTNVKGFFNYLRNNKQAKKGEPTSFHIGNAGSLLEQYGIKGKFMVGDYTFSRTHTENEDHNLSVNDWVNVINNLNNPLAITSYKGMPNQYRIYTYAMINGKNICVGVNVSLADGEISLSRIISAYGRDINNLLGKEKTNLIYPDIEELKRRISQGSTAHNSLLNATSTASGDKGTKKDLDLQGNEGKVSFSVRDWRKEIRDAAEANGTWLKAPNGNKSNLNRYDWVTARGEKFKKWFGDWENGNANNPDELDANDEPLKESIDKYKTIKPIFKEGFKKWFGDWENGEVKRPDLLDSNGMPSEEAISRYVRFESFLSDEFKQWFGDWENGETNFPGLTDSDGNPKEIALTHYYKHKTIHSKSFKEWLGDWENGSARFAKVLGEDGLPYDWVVTAYRTRPKYPTKPEKELGESQAVYFSRYRLWERAKDGYQSVADKYLDDVLNGRLEQAQSEESFIEKAQAKYEIDLAKWKEEQGIPDDATPEEEQPMPLPGERSLDYANRLTQWQRRQAAWKLAPKLENYIQAAKDDYLVYLAKYEVSKYPLSRASNIKLESAQLAKLRHAVARQKSYDKNTVQAVVDFAQQFLMQGFGDNISRGDIRHLLSAVRNATGVKDIKQNIDKIIDILVDNHIRNIENAIQKMASIKAHKMNAQNVSVQGKLELRGQRLIKAYNEARATNMTIEELEDMLSSLTEKMVDADPDTAAMYSAEYDGYSLALMYAKDITESLKEYTLMRKELRDAESNRELDYREKSQLIEQLRASMLDNRVERIHRYSKFIDEFSRFLDESIEGAKDFNEAQKRHQAEIYNMAMSDLAEVSSGTDPAIDRKSESLITRLSNNSWIQIITDPLVTFEQILKLFGQKYADGRGRLYNYFMQKWTEATRNEWSGKQKQFEILDDKAREIFGGKVKRWADLYSIVGKMPGIEVSYLDVDGIRKTTKLTQGNLLYIYMANKMTDGAIKLRKQGISESDMEVIETKLDPSLKSLADWVQSDFFVESRKKYNKIHMRLFGAPMAEIENYVPIRVLGDARYQEQDVANPEKPRLPSTVTGAIVNRRMNSLPLDIAGTDALSLVVEHVEEMEHWAAFAEFSKDISTLLSYTPFRNKVKNMQTVYGSGEELWKRVINVSNLAAGTYRPVVKSTAVDSLFTNASKGLTLAKVAFRINTALKQLVSAIGFLHDIDIYNLFQNPFEAWNWAIKAMPQFQERWLGRKAGDTRLEDSDLDWKQWRQKFIKMSAYYGMTPNAFVDAVVSSCGAYAVYKTKYKRYKNTGYDNEQAHKKALLDAEQSFNLTQQSSKGAYIATIQVDRTAMASGLSVFRNSSFSFARQSVEALRNLRRKRERGYKEEAINYMKGQMMLDGIPEDKAEAAAKAEYSRSIRRDLIRIVVFSYMNTIAWQLAGYWSYFLFGDDDEEKEKALTDALLRGMLAGPIEGLAGGNILSDLIGISVSSEGFTTEGLKNYRFYGLPAFSDIQKMIETFDHDQVAGLQDVINLLVQIGVGTNPETLTNSVIALIDYCNGDLGSAFELGLFLLRLNQSSSKELDNYYIDALGMSPDEIKKADFDELAKRWATYKMRQNAPMTSWLYSDEREKKKLKSYMKAFDKKVQKRMEGLTEEQFEQNYNRSESNAERLMAIKIGGEREGVKHADEMKNAQLASYLKKSTWDDIREDMEIEKKKRELSAVDKRLKAVRKSGASDEALELFKQENKKELDLYDDIVDTLKDIRDYQERMQNADKQESDELLNKIRKKRKELFERLE